MRRGIVCLLSLALAPGLLSGCGGRGPAGEGKEGIKLLRVDGTACTEETILDGSYPLQRPFVLVTRGAGTLSGQAQAFFDFAVSSEAGDLIRVAGAVPAV